MLIQLLICINHNKIPLVCMHAYAVCIFQRMKQQYNNDIAHYTEATCGSKQRTNLCGFLPRPLSCPLYTSVLQSFLFHFLTLTLGGKNELTVTQDYSRIQVIWNVPSCQFGWGQGKWVHKGPAETKGIPGEERNMK